jgi:hypothetical protein
MKKRKKEALIRKINRRKPIETIDLKLWRFLLLNYSTFKRIIQHVYRHVDSATLHHVVFYITINKYPFDVDFLIAFPNQTLNKGNYFLLYKLWQSIAISIDKE